ncbi:uncharacterized protein C2845_PM04G15460 [Panicum miliaceum]|uniref:Uncharacterized protein n=1 Tax=Panicum miliaceum TaxID=4540 RepID=A0A3L6QTS5_PANMI|nr:uncharacterized protein C2845_PM04G15460 [Panicum miliaceum]
MPIGAIAEAALLAQQLPPNPQIQRWQYLTQRVLVQFDGQHPVSSTRNQPSRSERHGDTALEEAPGAGGTTTASAMRATRSRVATMNEKYNNPLATSVLPVFSAGQPLRPRLPPGWQALVAGPQPQQPAPALHDARHDKRRGDFFPDLIVCEPLTRRYQPIFYPKVLRIHRHLGSFLLDGEEAPGNSSGGPRIGMSSFKVLVALHDYHMWEADRGVPVACVFPSGNDGGRRLVETAASSSDDTGVTVPEEAVELSFPCPNSYR